MSTTRVRGMASWNANNATLYVVDAAKAVIEDDGAVIRAPAHCEDADDVVRQLQWIAQTFRTDRQRGQSERIEVWCEAAGMIPQLERVADPYGITVRSSGGFDSTTTKHSAGQELGQDEPLIVLHIGDYDPSGVWIFTSLEEDVSAFARHYGNAIRFERLAVTPEQVSEYDLPTAPPKPTDNRRFDDNKTSQAEALDPRTLAAEVMRRVDLNDT